MGTFATKSLNQRGRRVIFIKFSC